MLLQFLCGGIVSQLQRLVRQRLQSIALTAPSHAVPGFSKEIVICNGETVVVPVKTHSPVPVRQWEPTAVPVSTTSKV
jgi:hypothetical protein